MNPAPLRHKTIVITRPKEQAAHLAELIHQAGGMVEIFPTIEIREPIDTGTLDAQIDRLSDFDLAIFISPTAVSRALDRISSRRTLPPGLQIAAIGQGSARELKKRGVKAVLAPTIRFDSEALLDLPELQQMGGKRVVIFRGEGGREVLAQTLRHRGATVEYAECYRRVRPAPFPQELIRRGLNGEIHAIVVTSTEGLCNLFEMAGESRATWLKSTPLFVSHPKIEQAGRKLGLTQLMVAESGDEALLQAIIAYMAGPK